MTRPDSAHHQPTSSDGGGIDWEAQDQFDEDGTRIYPNFSATARSRAWAA